ncbi:MAG: Asp-tRNA(Asn)/Glu-tRNA(Gln) amidotransferase subunit GatB [Phycisphaeraceae bacterium]|nr:Asp-tRNA(Asn)/Glu-tRNA(Gln) amidotransferase subunit GatB [Phycisphaerae bacterium]MBX3392321.1 Asp-tRNA(Asn)/Glu-tRNA(Gln) amidotransferase subunit GatB [Phycisphaeraceae bacterium]HRJ49162.1 Asp-tRNA(Asn)/Glu-tRNA(Gln) amidotransferase subunit GatB [Phycisphaerales bacterium]
MSADQVQIVSSTLVVGLEVHVELSTRTKMFSRCPSPAGAGHAEAAPNSWIDPVTLGLPGALPVINREAVEMSMMVGIALGCRIATETRWDRKGYFYPDLPKGYQISQYDLPVCFDGSVDLPGIDERSFFVLDGSSAEVSSPVRVGILRAHLEEDAGKLLHEAPGGREIDGSIVDYNRAGTPLLEIVTQPDFRSADQVVAFARLLRDTCRFLGVTQGVMQRGHMRFEPNINCHLTLSDGRLVKTPIVEIKNLNSFRSLKAAIEYEGREQPRRWGEDGREMGPGMKSTRGWDDDRGVSIMQRGKEDAHDYRYFPDPDLAPVVISHGWIERARARVPEIPLERLRRYVVGHGLGIKEATSLVEERETCLMYESCVALIAQRLGDQARAGRLAANAILQSGLKRANERGVPVHSLGITPGQVAGLAVMREEGRINAAAADELFGVLCESPGADPESLARERGLLIVRDDAAIERWIDQVLASNASIVDQVRAGKTQAVGRLVGETMKRAAGSADARTIREAILRRIGIKE